MSVQSGSVTSMRVQLSGQQTSFRVSVLILDPQLGNVVLNNLLSFFPRAANFFHPVLVTAPMVEIIGDRGVTAAGLVRILRHGGGWFDSSRYDAWRSAVHLRKSSQSFAVAHLACLFNVRDTRCRALSSTGTVPQAGSYGEHKEAWGFKPPRIRVNSVAYCPSPAFVTHTSLCSPRGNGTYLSLSPSEVDSRR